jgi:hypothetical protein
MDSAASPNGRNGCCRGSRRSVLLLSPGSLSQSAARVPTWTAAIAITRTPPRRLMGKAHPHITDALRAFILEQPLYFVATAPLSSEGHVNLSPKGLDTFRVLGPDRVAYLDLTGSGNETAPHLAENGRITFMFCSMSEVPRIVRLYGRGRPVLPDDAEWESLASAFPELPGIRQIIVAEIRRVQTSCGFGVPRMEEPRQRDMLIRWAESKGPEGLARYRAEKNTRSLDGLAAPGRQAEDLPGHPRSKSFGDPEDRNP